MNHFDMKNQGLLTSGIAKGSPPLLTIQQLKTDLVVIVEEDICKHCCRRKYYSIRAIFPLATLFSVLKYGTTLLKTILE